MNKQQILNKIEELKRKREEYFFAGKKLKKEAIDKKISKLYNELYCGEWKKYGSKRS